MFAICRVAVALIPWSATFAFASVANTTDETPHVDFLSDGVKDADVEAREKNCEVPLPDRTIPLMPSVPKIPASVRVFLKECCNITVNYSYYYDWQSNSTVYTTPEHLDNYHKDPAIKAYHAVNRGSPIGKVRRVDLLWYGVESAIYVLIAAMLYKSRVVDQRRSYPLPSSVMQNGQYHTGFWDCCENQSARITCCYAFCCPALRIADTLVAIDEVEFWKAVIGYIVCDIGTTLITASTDGYLLNLILAITFVLYPGWRVKLKQKLGATDQEVSTTLLELLQFLCCPCCAIAQDAREIDIAQGVEMVGCCMVSEKGRPLTGEPVAAMDSNR